MAAPFSWSRQPACHGLPSDSFTPTIVRMIKRTEFRRIAISIIAMLLPLVALAPAHAQSIEGTWDFRVDGTTIFRFEIEEGTDGEWLGEWHRPEVFNTDGNNFANMGGGVKSSPSMTGIEFLGQVELSFDDPRPGAVPDIFRFDLTGADTASMLYVGTDLAPYRLVRAGEGDPIGDWDASRVYRRRLPQEEPKEAETGIEPVIRTGGPTINFIDITPSNDAAASALPAAPLPAEEAEAVTAPDADEGEEAEAAEEPAVEEEDEAPVSLIGDDFLDGL